VRLFEQPHRAVVVLDLEALDRLLAQLGRARAGRRPLFLSSCRGGHGRMGMSPSSGSGGDAEDERRREPGGERPTSSPPTLSPAGEFQALRAVQPLHLLPPTGKKISLSSCFGAPRKGSLADSPA